MNFELTAEQEGVRARTREFAASQIRPRVECMDGEDRFPAEIWEGMKRYRLWGLPYPKLHGGSQEGYLSLVLAIEEMSRESVAVAATLSVHTMAAATIFHYGTDQQKRRFLPPLLSGEKIGSFAFTEAATGSDPQAITTTATGKKGCFVLNGTKLFSSNSTLDGFAVVFAKDQEKEGQITAFIVPKDVQGFTVSKPVRKMGMGGFETAPFTLTEVCIPEENAVGGEPGRGRGFQILMDIISIGKLGVAAQSLGLAERAMEEAVKYAGQRKQLNKPLRMFPTIQTLIAEMATEIEASRWLTYYAAFAREEGKSIILEGAMAKLFGAQTAKRVVDKSMSIHGCYAYTKDFTVERLYRDVKLAELYEGTNEMQKILIASRVLWSR